MWLQACQARSDLVQLQHRLKRDLDIFAACDSNCITEEEVTDYDVLLEYEYEEEEETPNSFFTYRKQPESKPKTCIRACKFADPNQNVDFKDISIDAYTVTPVTTTSRQFSKKDRQEFSFKSSDHIHEPILSLIDTTTESSQEETEKVQTSNTTEHCNVTQSSICNCNDSTSISPTLSGSTVNVTSNSLPEEGSNELNNTNKEFAFKNAHIDSALISQLIKLIGQLKPSTGVINENNPRKSTTDRPDAILQVDEIKYTTEKQDVIQAVNQSNPLTDELGVSSETNKSTTTEKDRIDIVRIIPKKIKYTYVEAELGEAGNSLNHNSWDTQVLLKKNYTSIKESSNESTTHASQTLTPHTEVNAATTDIYGSTTEVSKHLLDKTIDKGLQVNNGTTSPAALTFSVSQGTPSSNKGVLSSTAAGIESDTVSKHPTFSLTANPLISPDKIKFDFKYSISKHENISFFASNDENTPNQTEGMETASSPKTGPYNLNHFSNGNVLPSTTLYIQPVTTENANPEIKTSSEKTTFLPISVFLESGTKKEDDDSSSKSTFVNRLSTTEIIPAKKEDPDRKIKTSNGISPVSESFSSIEQTPSLSSIKSTPISQNFSSSTISSISTEAATANSSMQLTDTFLNRTLNDELYVDTTEKEGKMLVTNYGYSSKPTEASESSTSFPRKNTSVIESVNISDVTGADNNTESTPSQNIFQDSKINSTFNLYEDLQNTTSVEENYESSSSTVGLSTRDEKNKSSNDSATESKLSSTDLHWLKDPSLPNLSDLALDGGLNFPTLQMNGSKKVIDRPENSSDSSPSHNNATDTTDKNTTVLHRSNIT